MALPIVVHRCWGLWKACPARDCSFCQQGKIREFTARLSPSCNGDPQIIEAVATRKQLSEWNQELSRPHLPPMNTAGWNNHPLPTMNTEPAGWSNHFSPNNEHGVGGWIDHPLPTMNTESGAGTITISRSRAGTVTLYQQ
jgi:hypothetical protein